MSFFFNKMDCNIDTLADFLQRGYNIAHLQKYVFHTKIPGARQKDPEAAPEDFQLAASGYLDRPQSADRPRRDLWHHRPGRHRQSGQTQSRRDPEHQWTCWFDRRMTSYLNVSSMCQLSGLQSWPTTQPMRREGKPPGPRRAAAGSIPWRTSAQLWIAATDAPGIQSTASTWAARSAGQWKRSWRRGAGWPGSTGPTENRRSRTLTPIQSPSQRRQTSTSGNK